MNRSAEWMGMTGMAILGMAMAVGANAQTITMEPTRYVESSTTGSVTTTPAATTFTETTTTYTTTPAGTAESTETITVQTPQGDAQAPVKVVTMPAATVPNADDSWQPSTAVQQSMEAYYKGAIGSKPGRQLADDPQPASYATVETGSGTVPVIVRKGSAAN